MLARFSLPAAMPQRRILSVDIGGTLAKTAFYVPRNDPIRQCAERYEALTHDCIPSKSAARRASKTTKGDQRCVPVPD